MQRYFSNNLDNNKFKLSDNDLYHIKVVMRLKPNDKVEVVYNNQLHICTLDNNYNACISEIKINKINNTKKTILCIPLLQEQKMSLILQKATELNVSEIIPIITERSVIKIKEKEDKKIERWTKIVKEASEQSKRLDIPKISNIRKLNELDIEGLKLICSTEEQTNSIKKQLKLSQNYDTIIVAIGPEGGFSDKEEKQLKEQGFIPVTLGKNILRVETVPLYILSVINYEFME